LQEGALRNIKGRGTSLKKGGNWKKKKEKEGGGGFAPQQQRILTSRGGSPFWGEKEIRLLSNLSPKRGNNPLRPAVGGLGNEKNAVRFFKVTNAKEKT